MKSTRTNGGWMHWSLLAVWLALVVLVVPARAEEFSLSRCLFSGGAGRMDKSSHFACYEAQREYEVNRYRAAAERERQRRATEEATRQQEAEAQAQEADRAAKARQEAERARNAEAAERARRAGAAERARKTAEEVDAARRIEAPQDAQRRRAAEQFMPGMCPIGDLTAKCAMSSPDPVVEQIRRSQENAARGRPSR